MARVRGDIPTSTPAPFALRDGDYRTLIEHSPLMIWRSAKDGAVAYVNETCVRFTGLPIDRHVGYAWADNLHPEDRDHTVRTYRGAIERRAAFELRCRVRWRNGGYREVVARATPYFDRHGAFEGLLGGCMETHRDGAQLESATSA